MNRSLRTILLTSLSVSFLWSQWTYTRAISFPVKDSVAARPLLATVDKDNRLFVISSKIDDPRAHNAIYYALPADTVFRLMVDFDNNGDSDSLKGNIGALRGIAMVDNDVVVLASQPYPKNPPNTLSSIYYYPDADTNQVKRFGFNIAGSGYGSYNNGMDASKDSMIVTGINFGTSFRWYNFGTTFKKSAFGSWNTPDTSNTTIFSNAVEPRGQHTSGIDVIRDVAVVPGGNYYDKNTIFYTSRNSYSAQQQTGGIAVWQGGTQVQPINYKGNTVTDFSGFLAFSNAYPYGITVSSDGTLWVAGIDSTRRWVKGFKVEGVNAIEQYDLPSSSSMDIAVPEGAPMVAPSDIALTKTMSLAFVVDHYAKKVFRFKSTTVGVRGENTHPVEFQLQQNYPNPFNPSTLIAFTLPAAMKVRLVVSDMLGRTVRTIVDGELSAGKHVETFRAEGMPSGVYFYTLTTPAESVTRRMTLLK